MASQTNLFVGNLPPACDDGLLRSYFQPYGQIVSTRVMRDGATGACRGTGFVQYSNPASAATAIAALNGSNLGGNILVVKPADRNAGDKSAVAKPFGALPRSPLAAVVTAPQPSDNVFVGSLPFEWTEADLNALCGTCGPVVQSKVLTDKMTGRSKGAAMVRFADVATAANAVQMLNGFAIEGTGKHLEVKFADQAQDKMVRRAAQAAIQGMRFSPYGAGPLSPIAQVMGAGVPAGLAGIPQPPGGPIGANVFGTKIVVPKRADVMPEEGANLHIFGLDPGVTDLHLYQAFAGYGAIRSVRVMVDPATKASKGFGFVQFFNVQDAQGALAALNGLQVGSRVWSITVHKKKA